MANLQNIAVEALRAGGSDGLYHPDGECACKLDDLMPCGEPLPECRAGHLGACSCGLGCAFHIVNNPQTGDAA